MRLVGIAVVHVTATKHDMAGGVTVGDAADQTVVIKLAQGPM